MIPACLKNICLAELKLFASMRCYNYASFNMGRKINEYDLHMQNVWNSSEIVLIKSFMKNLLG